MMTLIAAAALAGQAPIPPATEPMTNHAQHQQAPSGEHKAMDCCKECCKHMGKMHSDQKIDGMQGHQEHGGR